MTATDMTGDVMAREERCEQARERALAQGAARALGSIGALAGFGPLTKIGANADAAGPPDSSGGA